jgi:OFA family oxalate/formate antiporter-like MFS transporter
VCFTATAPEPGPTNQSVKTRKVKITPKKAIFYGWWLVGAAALIYFVEASVVTTFGIYIKPIAMEFRWARSSTTLAFSFFMLATTLFGFVSGYATDRFLKPKWIIMVGGILIGLGLMLTSRVHALWQFYLSYSLLGGAGFACVYIPIVSSIPRWFRARQGLALGIFYAGGGVGGLIFSPLIESWIGDYGWRTAFVIMAIIVLCIIIPTSFFIKRDPSEKGLLPLGATASTGKDPSAKSQASPQAMGKSLSLAEAIRGRSLWIFCIAFSLILAGILMAQINLVPNATDVGIASATASLALGFANGFNAAGRLAGGYFADRIGTRKSMIFCLLLGAATLFYFIIVDQPWMLFLFAIPFGFAYGFSLPQQPRIAAELFGVKNLGAIMGFQGFLGVWGPAFGPFLGAYIFDHTGNYKIAFLAGGIGLIIGLGLILMLKLKSPVRAAAKTD